jgi:transcriptional regulator with XRE-family HTH domain
MIMPMPRGWKKYGDYDWQAFGAWLRDLRTRLGWTLSQLGGHLQITNKGTVARIEQGRQGLSRQQRERAVNALIEALPAAGADPDAPRASRRDFLMAAGLQLAGLALAQSGGASSSAQAPARQALASLSSLSKQQNERAAADELIYDLGVGLIETWDEDLFQGRAQRVARQAENRYRALAMSPYLADEECALTAIRVGIRLARAREALNDWFKHSQIAIATYTHVEQHILRRFAHPAREKRAIKREHAQLLALRASLLRGIGKLDEAAMDLQQSMTLARELNDSLLYVDSLCEFAHVWISYGDSGAWERGLDAARAAAQSAPVAQRAGLLALVTYYEGAGQRRFAFDEGFALNEREKVKWADSAIRNMRASREQLGDEWSHYVLEGNLAGHPLITCVSEAQCQIWTEPEGVEEEVERLRPHVVSDLPTLLAKFAVSASWPAARLQWPAHNGLPLFDLSGKRDVRGNPLRRQP